MGVKSFHPVIDKSSVVGRIVIPVDCHSAIGTLKLRTIWSLLASVTGVVAPMSDFLVFVSLRLTDARIVPALLSYLTYPPNDPEGDPAASKR